MMHPDTELRYVNATVGYGVFATADIPKGTLVYVQDPFEIEITAEKFETLESHYQALVEKFSVIDAEGNRVMSWDLAKYVNHCCQCNTISTGFGFEIAICDIQKGQQITDEYGLFNMDQEFHLVCDHLNCRQVLRPSDVDMYYSLWDSWVIDALESVMQVTQPLWVFMDEVTRQKLLDYLVTKTGYPSVKILKRPRFYQVTLEENAP